MQQHPRSSLLAAAILIAIAATAPAGRAQPAPTDALVQGFLTPPDSAKPRTWWHWTNGNVTKEGITKDLEWMKRVGIGGFQLADVGSGSGQVVDKKILFGTPEWFDAVHHAAAEADRLGLEMSIFSSAGWSETGGPWVKPEQAMKKLVWSELTVEGPRHFAEKLPQPPSDNGPIRNLRTGGARGGTPDPTFYGDSAVLAYRTPADESRMADEHPQVSTNNGPIDGKALMDDDLNSALSVSAPTDGSPAWVQFAFDAPFKARAVTLAARGGIPVGRLSASDDGKSFRTLVELPGAQLYRGGLERTFSFPETAARFFRLEMAAAPLRPAITMSQERPQPAQQYSLSEFTLSSAARVHRWEEKAGFSFLYRYDMVPTPPVPDTSRIPRGEIVQLTSKLLPDGTLQWDVPPGKWTILRLGYSLTGAKNRPAPPTGSGYEVDKLSRKYVESYFHGYFDRISDAVGPLVGKSLRYVTMDSWEAGMQNWTDDMIGEFKSRRGYDPTPYLPALTGRVVESADVSDRFLWDFRRTLAEMFAENHFGTMADLLKQRGIGIYGEAAGVSMEILEDTLLNKSKVAIPMGEFWVHALHPELQYYVDVRGAASAAHAYAKPIVATESFTGGGYESPFTLKTVGDYWFAQGVNRFVFHTSAQQPLDTKPGNTMVGTHLNRNITWAEQAGPFMTYLARNSYMLQQGRFVADLAYLLPEGAPSSQPFWGGGLHPRVPEGYDYDCINTDVLLNRMSVAADGRLTLPDGMSYRLLVLPESQQMRPEVARKIRDLVAGGATIVGPRPLTSPSLADYPQADGEVSSLAAEVWGDLDGVMRNRRYFGKGCVVWGFSLEETLASLNVQKDFESSKPLDGEVVWLHRQAENADIFYVANHTDQPTRLEARFRVAGKEAEIWHPDSGAIEPASYSISDNHTTVPLQLAQREAVFVVFRHPAAAPARAVAPVQSMPLATLGGAWDVAFPPHSGAPDHVQFPSLVPWTSNDDAGIHYFSGTASYTKSFEVPDTWTASGARLLLDLGDVKDIAQVIVNGKDAGILWKPPYRADITDALKPGTNKIEVRITNEWTNRQIGDRLLPPDQRILSSAGEPTARPGAKAPPLPPSGLMGPVLLLRTERTD